ncbi:MAG: hypothetical protein LBP34_00950 [Flavobacteriaceae bacterium]|jgi:hypothetical protein|nr:hypothetical protein [Flavobacteriaceae bacterium]
MAKLLEFILFAVVAYFVFKFLNRLFSSSPKAHTSSGKYQFKEQKQRSKKDIDWNAETVDYEEVETENNEKK